MIKLISTILLTLLLTACGSQESGEKDAEINTKASTPLTVEKPKEKVSSNKTEAPETSAPKTFAKDIFALPTLDGKTLHVDEAEEGITFQEHKGKVVFLLFFGYRCPPCLAEIPTLNAMVKENHDDMEIIAVEVQRLSTEKLKTFRDKKEIKYTLLSGEDEETSKFIAYIGQRAQWGGSIPFLVALNPKGEVKVVHVGGMGAKAFKTIYEKLKTEK